MKAILISAFALLLTCATKGATSVSVHWYTDGSFGNVLANIAGVPLTRGTAAFGDGAVLQLGYYTGATQSSPFSGNWMPLTGPGSLHSITSTIGDSIGFSDGKFAIITGFKSDEADVPPPGRTLAIRFYDATSLATANYFNAVTNTDGTWNWITGDPEPTLNLAILLSSPTQVWQGGADSAFRTTIPVPEPSVLWLVAGSAWLAFWRRRDGPR